MIKREFMKGTCKLEFRLKKLTFGGVITQVLTVLPEIAILSNYRATGEGLFCTDTRDCMANQVRQSTVLRIHPAQIITGSKKCSQDFAAYSRLLYLH
jgi:hypothetical protein